MVIRPQKITCSTTLVDQVVESIVNFFRENNLKPGSLIPKEIDLASSIGVSRSVVREALSQLKMLGLVESRTKRGMVLCEPNIFAGMKLAVNPNLFGDAQIYDILQFRTALEIGISDDIIGNVTDDDIRELEEIIKNGSIPGHNLYTLASDTQFHTKLISLTGNQTMTHFQEIIYPIMVFLRTKFSSQIDPYNAEVMKRRPLVTHDDLLNIIKKRDANAYREAIKNHLSIYGDLLEMIKKQSSEGLGE